VIELTSAGFFNAPNLVFYLYDHGSSLVFGDWVTNYAALTEVATVTAPGSAQTFQVTLDADGLAAVNAAIAAGSTVGFMWVSANIVAGTAPSGDERYQHAASENGTAASRPALIVEYDIPAPIPVFDHHYRMMRAA
jgi:hypothetical protein